MPRLTTPRAYVALVLIVVLWASYPATTKLALRDFQPVFLVTVRCAIASLYLTLMLRRSGTPGVAELGWPALAAFLALGVSGIVVSTHLTYVAIYFTTASNAAILQAATPVMVALGARFYLGERLRGIQWAGVAVSALGVLSVITSGRLATLRLAELRGGDFLVLGALGGWSAYTVYGKRVLASYSPALATTAAYVLGTLLLFPIAVLTAPLFPAPRLASGVAWAVVLYHALLGAVAHVWWYRAVEVVGASRAAIFMNLQPVVGLALAGALLGEQVGGWELAGGALVLLGVALTTRGRER